MDSKVFLTQILERMTSSITPSTVRRQGPAKTLSCVQDFLANPQLLESFLEAQTQESFVQILDKETKRLQFSLPKSDDGRTGQHWGTARKCLNIFLFECCMNRYLCDHYKNLPDLEKWLEVPLDRLVGEALMEDAKKLLGRNIPAWDTIKGLKQDRSDEYQRIATEIAKVNKTYRIHLELRYWMRPKEGDRS